MIDRSKEARAFGDFLVAQKVMDGAAVSKLVAAAESTRHPLDTLLLELGMIGEDELSIRFAQYLDIKHVMDPTECLSEDLIEAIGLEYLDNAAILPSQIDDENIALVVSDPVFSDAAEITALHLDKSVSLICASRRKIRQALEGWRQRTGQESGADSDTVHPDQLEADELDRLKDIASEAPIIRLLSNVVQQAVGLNASDIHVEPLADSVRVRMRCDGVLIGREDFPKSQLAGLSTRIKILSGLNIAERRLPQDGRMRMAIRGRQIDMRVSVLPSVHGETFVLRLLDRETMPLELDRLGYEPQAVTMLQRLATLSNGIVLITGPTGSGKTTTLYSMLNEIDMSQSKVFTVEDPVEFKLSGITQVQVNSDIGLGFARTLRTVLRQDPDVILIGEIRDAETAEIAVRAALTGHLVLSTLHTNSAAGAFSRLIDMGIEPYLLSDTVRAVVGQRLVRVVCRRCRNTGGSGCRECDETGYRGRTAVYEILEVTPRLLGEAKYWQDESAIVACARHDGYQTLTEHAEKLVSSGITDRRETSRVLSSGAS